MTLAGRKGFGVAALLCAGHLLAAPVPAQAAANNPALPQSNPAPASRRAIEPPPPPELLPPLPINKSPISFFRELLAMNAAERKQALTNRSPESRTQILAKVREYQSLKPNERELRLQVTELHWYLLPLMRAPATNRPAQLANIPSRQRSLVEDRLREWDKLPAAVQQELLENQVTLRYLAEIEGRTDEQRREMLKSIPPARRDMLEKGIARWDAMSGDQRRRTLSRFNQFFELTVQEKDKALRTLSGPERRQIEKTLQTFGNLPPEQRAACIRSFAKFASLSLEERHQFLKNAERWQAMSPTERQTWRDLVRNLPPPLPPDLPPLPPSRSPPRRTPAIVTNGN
jgi:hypothetical protein